eukprot:gene17007-35249_t
MFVAGNAEQGRIVETKRAELTAPEAAGVESPDLWPNRIGVPALLRPGTANHGSRPAGWLPGVLAQYRAEYPGIEIDIADVLSAPCIDRVASGHADLALAAIRADTPALQAEPFCSDDFYLVCPADHPLARRRKAITAQDLAAWPFIHLARTSSVRQYLEAALHPQAMHTLMEVEQLATVMGMVRAGLGISVVPALTLFHFDQPGLVTRPLSLPGLTRQIYLVRRRDESLSVAAQALYALTGKLLSDKEAGPSRVTAMPEVTSTQGKRKSVVCTPPALSTGSVWVLSAKPAS